MREKASSLVELVSSRVEPKAPAADEAKPEKETTARQRLR
jgi:hypothetical protein